MKIGTGMGTKGWQRLERWRWRHGRSRFGSRISSCIRGRCWGNQRGGGRLKEGEWKQAGVGGGKGEREDVGYEKGVGIG
ncbi:hypothetical protein GOP47_0027630 [Adiantum capillus-veneris]|nr:hypothetical protein GOP47_0027630 [Adiantum capillus-veneris]